MIFSLWPFHFYLLSAVLCITWSGGWNWGTGERYKENSSLASSNSTCQRFRRFSRSSVLRRYLNHLLCPALDGIIWETTLNPCFFHPTLNNPVIVPCLSHFFFFMLHCISHKANMQWSLSWKINSHQVTVPAMWNCLRCSNKRETLPLRDLIALGNPVNRSHNPSGCDEDEPVCSDFGWEGHSCWGSWLSFDGPWKFWIWSGGRTRRNKGKDKHRHRGRPSLNVPIEVSAQGLCFFLCLSGKPFSLDHLAVTKQVSLPGVPTHSQPLLGAPRPPGSTRSQQLIGLAAHGTHFTAHGVFPGHQLKSCLKVLHLNERFISDSRPNSR